MAFIQRHTVVVTVNASGDAVAYTAEPVNGFLLGLAYVKTDYANGVDFTITAETGGAAIWTGTDVNASTAIYPRAQVYSTAGAGPTYDGTRQVCEPVPLANERIKIVVANGGVSTTGTFHFYVGG